MFSKISTCRSTWFFCKTFSAEGIISSNIYCGFTLTNRFNSYNGLYELLFLWKK
jgi:hypothetical protein